MIGVRVVVDGAAPESPEVLVAAFQGTVFGKASEMPLADQGGLVAGRAQQGRESRKLGRYPDVAPGDRFLEPGGQAILVPAGDEREPGGRADGAVGIGA